MNITLAQPNLLRNQSYINGQWVPADSGKTFAVTNPANGETIADLADCGADETTRAIEAADVALTTWRRKTAKERSLILRKWHQLILDNQEDLGKIMTLEQGKPLAEAKGEILYGASFIDWFADEARRIYGDVIPTFAEGKRVLTIKQPVGVVATITPWNFPNAMIARKIAPALAAGCTVVARPSKETPLSALALAELAHQAGVPEGVLNIIVGSSSKDVGGVMTSHPTVRKLSFTGSTPVGKALQSQCSDTVKRTSMELGGNAPFIVFDDADIDAAIEGLMGCKFRNAGQVCISANRILVQDGIYDEFADKLTKRVAELKTGNGLEEDVKVGPLINKGAVEKVVELVDDAVKKGAQVTVGGHDSEQGDERYYQPTVLTNVTDDMDVFSTEIFGPVAALYRFKTEDEAIERANNTPFGLASYFYSQGFSRIWRVSEALEYGMVGINEGGISTEVAPFGGIKESGNGREGSKYGIDDYVEIKYLCMGGIQEA
ncbi:Succinate-semialdehyde dehydrogenase [NADP(+)] GabD [Marinomonas gallaica]|uniref:Succinate-semialdehyde dehydrogenase [NADP(+)] GabD n=1 Tax=Marinomonas gallaica TaxID=1806667 RepID=A0A1C3JRA0_9GAMM|nr:NAD-dependent succinate-semialdehyde dehydrogenase [Marinomonas gallaica]SBT17771.1 Succinate-semialdehyde dehydrogenase [NADP(+)] GabD [Marinomonas gallaica]SBT20097.1 Succinate-semialdehyde dehydrogenase [NADP(+)] GabD [Marinomonas gallaica]